MGINKVNRNPLFTVATATYNRAHLLPRAYASLCKQTLQDFEWVMVDDGSTDDTRDRVAAWQAEAPFPIRYAWQAHAGRSAALRHAVDLAQGSLWIPLDSDDEAMPDALERFARHWFAIPDDQRDRFTGVTGRCIDQNGNRIGAPLPAPVFDSDSLSMRFRRRIPGERWGFNRTDILRRFPYPILTTLDNIPSSVVWTQIARHYQTRYIDEMVRVYYIDHAPDQLTAPGAQQDNHAGYALEYQTLLNHAPMFARYAPMAFARIAANYARKSWHLGRGVREQARSLSHPLGVALWLLMLPLAYLRFQRDWHIR